MSQDRRNGFVLVALTAVAAAAFLYNKQLNLEAEKQRAATEERLHERALRCAEDGRKFAAAYFAEEESAALSDHQTAWDDPEFHYNTQLGTCLVRTRFVEIGSITYQHARVTDLSTNQPVAESYVKLTADRNKSDGSLREELSDFSFGKPNMTRAAFVQKADELMKK